MDQIRTSMVIRISFDCLADSIPETRIFPKTPRCPACDSGMVAPGIRHNADCKRRRAAFDAENSPSVVGCQWSSGSPLLGSATKFTVDWCHA